MRGILPARVRIDPHRGYVGGVRATGGTAAAHLPSPFWGKANNFRRLFEFLLYYVATIKLAYIEIFP